MCYHIHEAYEASASWGNGNEVVHEVSDTRMTGTETALLL